MSDRPDPLIGTHLGDYTIEALIGRGGMARVYEALDEKLGRKAAVKVIEAEHEKADEMTQRFIREARAAANLDHPNIISVYQFGEDGNLYYMAMKLIEGHTLLNILKKRRQQKKFMEPQEVLSIASQIAAALDYAHSKGVIHRDIKPSNIMLTDENRAILTDFGLTMQLGADSTLGTAFGTPRYISPEQAMASHRAVPQSDIYSLGVVLYEMTTGQAPFDSDSPMSLALSHISNPPPEPKSVRPDLPHPVQMVLLKALEKRPENRWQTATEMVEALRSAYQGIEPNVTLSQEKLDTPPSRRTSLDHVENDATDATALISSKQLPGPRRRGVGLSRLARVLFLLVAIGVIGGGFLAFKYNGTLPAQASLYPTPTPFSTSDIRLIYSKDAFYIYNASE
ncbi:MAG TPA: protein kinase, partial [Aggregatilineales bacterium]|nr:protein kinase [Aggregatilineales bacterium]